jgi:hypothetical protein
VIPLLDSLIKEAMDSKVQNADCLAELFYIKHKVDLAMQHKDAGKALEMFNIHLKDGI